MENNKPESLVLSFAYSILSAVILIGVIVSLSSCATSSPKEQEYRALIDRVNDLHSAALVPSDKPFLFTSDSFRGFEQEYMADNCVTEDPQHTNSKRQCEHHLWDAVFDRLSEEYYSADETDIELSCRQQPIVCADPESLEVIFRKQNNVSVEKSRSVKINAIKQWYEGKLSASQLMNELSFSFQFSDGNLIVTKN